ncbi:major capsid protein [Intestinibacillus massiliensis]|uniref:major capsid protein n=1 Tax=Intestinibacillus massiliensis TaxID=1871029 RepID=UPI000B36367C|nr:major capsid protein [Intestinibacillus massiliensis]MCB6366527.1 major capsid protein [Intestinibacillus massiliensis]
MAGTIFGIPFDEELFLQMWGEAPDLVKAALLDSGVMVEDPAVEGMIQTGGNLYTIPFFNVLDGAPQNYDGRTDITADEAGGGSQTGVVYGRARGFTARNFTADLSGADPVGHIAGAVGRYWAKYRQSVMIGILDAVFGISGASGYAKEFAETHVADLSSATAAPYKIGETDLNDLATQAMGDQKGAFRVAVMHSNVARTLENLQLLEYWKQTDANGLQRPLNIAAMGGYTVVIDDSVPVQAVGGEGENKALKRYTTYLLGEGVLRHANGRLDHPADTRYDPEKNGGQETLYTRLRETIHPNGFSFKVPSSGWTDSPTDAQLFSPANWSVKFDPKAIPLAKLVTNG